MKIEDSNKADGDGDAIKVFVRVRPPAKQEGELDHGTCLDVNMDANSLKLRSKPEPKTFTFDHVADMYTAQEAVFSRVGRKLIDSCVSGYNGTIFAYGQTGSGKTFTMLGPSEDADNFQHELRGIIPRSFEYLFSLISRQKELHGDKIQFLCRCSFLEIYQEQIFDLLDPASAGLHLRENIKKGVFVDGLIEQTVGSATDAYQVLTAGWLNRTVASTSMNRESSRSHAVFTLQVESKEMKNGVWNIKVSQLNLVDLAGSERQKDTNASGIRLKEAGNINKSLSALGNVIMALVDVAHGKNRFVPYRDSKLSFLLRDSLGGNAKTHMIACVHPGAKCFGETLSTLQFARRAKMIKNKAVVNENASGSVEHLQKEIVRLKEALLSYQQGSIPAAPSGDGDYKGSCWSVGCVAVDNEGAPISNAAADTLWKKHFLEAMFFREKSEQDKRNLLEKHRRLEEASNRKEQALRQSKMVLKFREEALKKIEKAHKQKTDLDPDQKDAIITSLRGEVKGLSELVEHHPEVTKYHHLNENLKQEVQKLRAQSPNANIVHQNRQKAGELERIFKELLAEKEKDGDRRTPYSTPQASEESNVAVATLERFKSQIQKLQDEIETVKREAAEEKTQLEKSLMEKESALVSSQKVRDELEKVLKAHHIRTRIERETTDHMHMETIKTMTTPTKARYNLRNRLVMPGSGGTPPIQGLQLNESGDEETLSDMAPPPEMADERAEALAEEIKKLQEDNRLLKTQHENNESEKLKLVENTSRLESQNMQLEEMLAKEKGSLTAKMVVLEKELAGFSEEKRELEERCRILDSEVQDLRIMSQFSEKRLVEDKKEWENWQLLKNKEVATMETKLVQLELSCANVQRDLDKTTEEKEQLNDAVENLQAQVNFSESQVSDLEAELLKGKEVAKKLQLELQTCEKKLNKEEEKSKSLQHQLEIKGNTELELSEAYINIEKIRNELQLSQSVVEAQNVKLQLVTDELKTTREQLAVAERGNQERKDAINNLLARINEQREQISERDSTICCTSTQLEEATQRIVQLETNLHAIEKQLQTSEDQYRAELVALTTELQMKKAELDVLNDDHEEQSERLDAAMAECQASLKDNETLGTEMAALEETILALNVQLEKQTSATLQAQEDLETKLRQVEERYAPKDSAIEELAKELSERDAELIRYRCHVEELKQLYDDQAVCLTEKSQQIEQLQTALAKTVAVQSSADEVTKKYEEVKEEFEALHAHHTLREAELMQELQDLRSRADQADEETHQASQERDRNNTELVSLRECLEVLHADMAEREQQLERYEAVAKKDQEEKEHLNSEREELKETSLKLTKQLENQDKKLQSLRDENARLSGHTNIHQKIQHVQSLKDELAKCQELLRQKSSELAKSVYRCKQMEAQLKQHEHCGTPAKKTSKSSADTPKKQVAHVAPHKLTPNKHLLAVDATASSQSGTSSSLLEVPPGGIKKTPKKEVTSGEVSELQAQSGAGSISPRMQRTSGDESTKVVVTSSVNNVTPRKVVAAEVSAVSPVVPLRSGTPKAQVTQPSKPAASPRVAAPLAENQTVTAESEGPDEVQVKVVGGAAAADKENEEPNTV